MSDFHDPNLIDLQQLTKHVAMFLATDWENYCYQEQLVQIGKCSIIRKRMTYNL